MADIYDLPFFVALELGEGQAVRHFHAGLVLLGKGGAAQSGQTSPEGGERGNLACDGNGRHGRTSIGPRMARTKSIAPRAPGQERGQKIARIFRPGTTTATPLACYSDSACPS